MPFIHKEYPSITGTYNISNFPSAANVFHILTLTAIIDGYTGYSGNVQYTIYPTIAVVNSGDICRILEGYGISSILQD